MRKIIVDFIIISGVFLLLFFSFLQIDYIGFVERVFEQGKYEEKIGNVIWESVQLSNVEVENPEIISSVNHIKDEICDANGINSDIVKIHIVYNDEVNAFALPDHYMVIYSGLIASCETPEELAGVMAHEIAHMELNHVMKKLTKELGIATLAVMVGGNAGYELLGEIARVISSTAYSRNFEREADAKAVVLLENANIDPSHFSSFLNKLTNGNFPNQLSWISTHPDSEERSKTIMNLKKEDISTPKILIDPEQWDNLKNFLIYKDTLN